MTTSPSLFIQFQNGLTSETTGSALNLPSSTTPKQLEVLLNQILHNGNEKEFSSSDIMNKDEYTPFTFRIEGEEIIKSLSNVQPKSEGIIKVVYEAQASFRVHAVSRCSSSMAGHEATILCTSFSPDGRYLASGSGDSTVRFWDLQTETPVPGTLKPSPSSSSTSTITGHAGWVLCMSWSPDGLYLATGSMDNQVLIWSRRGKLLCRLRGHKQSISSLAWEPLHLHSGSTTTRLASSSRDFSVKIWEIIGGDDGESASPRLLSTLGQHTQAVTCLRWGGDGTIYTGSRDRDIRLWKEVSANIFQCVQTLKGHAHWINTMALNTDHLLRTGAFDNKNTTIQMNRSKSIALAKERYSTSLEAIGGQEIMVSGSDDFTLFMWNASNSSSKPMTRMTGHQALVNHVAFSPDGRFLASASFDKGIKLWCGRTGTFVGNLRGHVGRVYQLSWSSDSRLLLSASADATLKVWDPRLRSLRADLPGHADEIYALDWSPASAGCGENRCASGGRDKFLKIWKQ